MEKNRLKKLTLVLIVGVLIGIFSILALASSATGIFGYYGPVLGYSYKNQNTIIIQNNNQYASTDVMPSDSQTIPSGYMGTRTRLYKDGAVQATSPIYYNSGPSTFHSCVISGSYGSGTYYAKGSTFAYNGSGYAQYSSFQSPNQTQ